MLIWLYQGVWLVGVAWSHVMETRLGEVVVCPGAAGHLHSSRSLEESKRHWDN